MVAFLYLNNEIVSFIHNLFIHDFFLHNKSFLTQYLTLNIMVFVSHNFIINIEGDLVKYDFTLESEIKNFFKRNHFMQALLIIHVGNLKKKNCQFR